MDNQEILIKLHEIELELLEELHRICSMCGIQYFLDSGTALGAVRHGGFIPWDDDIDVGMLRTDYDKFIKIAPEVLSSDYCLQSHETDPYYSKFHVKLRKWGTEFPEVGTENLQCRGIFIDIFPFDYVSDKNWVAKLEIKLGVYLRHRWAIRKFGSRKNLYKKILSQVIKIFPVSFFEKLIYLLVHLHSGGTSHLICHFYKMRLASAFETTWFLPTKNIEFEGKCFQIMNNVDAYLQLMYGDYMKLPPLESRKVHFEGQIKF